MSYSANQYNYATPLSGSSNLTSEKNNAVDTKYFTLSDNVLDGTYFPITDDVGLWGSVVSDSNGILDEPFVVTITDASTINAVRLTFSKYCYPVDFSVAFYNNAQWLHEVLFVDNSETEVLALLPDPVSITHYVVTISKVSKAANVARLYNVYSPWYIASSDDLSVATINSTDVHFDNNTKILSRLDRIVITDASACFIDNVINVSNDTLVIAQTEKVDGTVIIEDAKDTVKCFIDSDTSHVTNIIDVASDTLKIANEDSAVLTNIHTVMKEPSRRTYGKVEITYVDPMLDNEVLLEPLSEAYNSNIDQIFDGVYEPEEKYFTLYDNDLSGEYLVSDQYSQVGWVSAEVSNDEGVFEEPVGITVKVFSRPIISFRVVFDNSRNNLVKDFKFIFTKADGSTVEFDYVDNDKVIVDTDANIADVVSVQLLITRIERPNAPAVVLSMPLLSSVLYKGYDDESQLMSIDLFEELSYEDEIEMLGGVSANEITVILDNSNRDFFFNSGSLVSNQLKRNRKIVPWLGAEVVPGEIEWHELGTFWSYKWDVPVDGLTATVVGFDTIGLLGNTPYTDHQVQIGKSIGYLLEYILDDAKKLLHFIEYVIDESLYDIVIPYAWFENKTHAAALRRLSLCYPMHIYCDRKGRICAAPQKLHLDYYYDEWSEDTNVIDTKYSSLYTALPNIVNVTVHNPVIQRDESLVESTTPFSVAEMESYTLNFSKPYLSDIVVTIDCDETVEYTYLVYSWGIVLNFTGEGYIRSILCTGTCLDTSSSSVITRQDATRVMLDGAINRDVDSPFIQTIGMANNIISRFFELLETDKYDATVVYRGDIALAINDPILLQESLAPDNKYNIKRHQLTWNGALTGSAELNT